MPFYDYRCSKCGHTVEINRPMISVSDVECPECGHEMNKVWFPVAVSFKGSGFYRTDSRKVNVQA